MLICWALWAQRFRRYGFSKLNRSPNLGAIFSVAKVLALKRNVFLRLFFKIELDRAGERSKSFSFAAQKAVRSGTSHERRENRSFAPKIYRSISGLLISSALPNRESRQYSNCIHFYLRASAALLEERGPFVSIIFKRMFTAPSHK